MTVPEIIKTVQRNLGLTVDGIAGPKTWAAIAKALGLDTASLPCATPQKAIDFILEAEGIDQPSQWPGAESGVTIGYGYDLGYETNFENDWAGRLNETEISTLKNALGKRGEAARKIAPAFKNITINRNAAKEVFFTKTLPQYENETRHAFPGVEQLPDLAFGALVSLVFNRGTGMVGARRAEMRAIRDLILRYAESSLSLGGCCKEIAAQLRAMKALWTGKGLDGLLKRREAEARMVEEALAS
jgi:GH24 family phage-related lysozyme (muramidase)